MIVIPLYVAVLQWVILLCLGFLVLLMYRQLDRQMRIGAEEPEVGLPTGAMAAAFDYVSAPASGSTPAASFAPASGRPTLLLFADPSCMACDSALRELEKTVGSPPGDDLRILVATSEPDHFLAASEAFRSTTLPLARVPREVARAYRVAATPFAYGIGPDGSVRAHVVPRSATDFEALANAARTGSAAEAAVEIGHHSMQEV